MNSRNVRPIAITAAAFAAVVFPSCKSSESSGRVKPTGALGDTGRFVPEAGDKGNLIWIDRSTDFSKFDAVYIPRITVRGTSKPNKKDKLSDADRQALADYFQGALLRELGKDRVSYLMRISTVHPWL